MSKQIIRVSHSVFTQIAAALNIHTMNIENESINTDNFTFVLDKTNTTQFIFNLTYAEIMERIEFWNKHHAKKSNLMTREEARLKVFNTAKSFEGRECLQLVEALEALGLIKFSDNVNNDDQIISDAEFKYCREIVSFDNKQSLNTITEMAKTIRKLLKIIKK